MGARTLSRVATKPDRSPIPLVVKVDGAHEVAVTGDFIGWSEDGISLHQIQSGEWAVKLDLPPGEYQYRLKVDGQWRDHSDALRRVPNPFGSENCVLTVS